MSSTIDLEKIRREQLRWLLVLVLDRARPYGLHESVLLGAAQDQFRDASALEVRRALDYLEDRRLVIIKRSPAGPWEADITRYGTDIAEYTIECEPGIARPLKYW